jgi:DNA-binding beta-propeller fold protein YncE
MLASRRAAAVLLALLAAACSKSSGSTTSAPTPTTYAIGGAVSGLAASGLVLELNGANDLAVSSNGQFTFRRHLADGGPYAVTVKTQPRNPAQVCTVAAGSGTVAGADVTDVAVTCVAATYTVGGTVSGLTGTGLVLQNDGADDLPIAADGPFTFPAAVAALQPFAVTVKTQPVAQFCAVTGGAGLSSTNVTTVTVTCQAPPPRWAFVLNGDGTVSGFAVEAVTGQLRTNGYAVTGVNPLGLAAHPAGSSVYVANAGDNSVSAFSVDLAGALHDQGTVSAGLGPRAVTVDPTGRFAFAASPGSDGVEAFEIAPESGALAPINTVTAPGSAPGALAVEPGGRYLYVANRAGSVSAYAIHPTAGAITPVGAAVPMA